MEDKVGAQKMMAIIKGVFMPTTEGRKRTGQRNDCNKIMKKYRMTLVKAIKVAFVDNGHLYPSNV